MICTFLPEPCQIASFDRKQDPTDIAIVNMPELAYLDENATCSVKKNKKWFKTILQSCVIIQKWKWKFLCQQKENRKARWEILNLIFESDPNWTLKLYVSKQYNYAIIQDS